MNEPVQRLTEKYGHLWAASTSEDDICGFIEEIVKECVKRIDTIEVVGNASAEFILSVAAQAILDHFGVKE